MIKIMFFTSCSQVCWYPSSFSFGKCRSPSHPRRPPLQNKVLLTLLIVPHEKQLTSIVKLGKTVILAHQRQTGPKTATWLVRNVQRCTAVLSHIWPIRTTCELHQVAAVTCTFRVYNAWKSLPFSWLRSTMITFGDFEIENYKRKNYPKLFFLQFSLKSHH